MKVAVVGTGYVGLVTGAVLAELGNDVICVDRDAAKVAKIQSGQSPIYEPGLDEILTRVIDNGLFRASTDLPSAVRAAEVVFIAVGTPPGPDGTPDLSQVEAVAREMAPHIEKYTVVVNKSTVPVGTGQMVEDLLLSLGVPADKFDVVSNPEFLREGSAIFDTFHPDRVVIGYQNKSAGMRLVELYAPLEAPMILTSRNSAELIKYASNSFLAVKISFINAISRICEKCDADVDEVAKGMGYDKRIGNQFLQAGLGWGGSCFPKDVQGLNKTGEKLGYTFDLLTAADQINKEQTIHFLMRLQERLGGVEGKTISLLGLAFKPNTDDIRDAKSLEIIEFLKARGAVIRAYDPVAAENVRQIHPDIIYTDSAMDCVADADAVILVTEWQEFRNLNLRDVAAKVKSKILFDGRRAYRRDKAIEAGFEYFTVGA